VNSAENLTLWMTPPRPNLFPRPTARPPWLWKGLGRGMVISRCSNRRRVPLQVADRVSDGATKGSICAAW